MRIDLVHFGGWPAGGDGGPSPSAVDPACEEAVLSRNCLRPDDALDVVGVGPDTPVAEEALDRGPSAEGIADRLGGFRLIRQLRQFLFPKRKERGYSGGPDVPPFGQPAPSHALPPR